MCVGGSCNVYAFVHLLSKYKALTIDFYSEN